MSETSSSSVKELSEAIETNTATKEGETKKGPEAVAVTKETEVSKDASVVPSQTATTATTNKSSNNGYRGGMGGKRMMGGYRPMFPLQMKSEICEDFSKGTCSRGSRCPFLHVAAAGSSKALAMTRGNTGIHNNTAKPQSKGEPQTEGTKKASKKKKRKNAAAKKAQEKTAEGTDSNVAATTTTNTNTTTSTTASVEGEEKTNTPNQSAAKAKKAKNQRRQTPEETTTESSGTTVSVAATASSLSTATTASSTASASSTSTAATTSVTPSGAKTGGVKQTGRKHRAPNNGIRQPMMNVGNVVCVNYLLGACRYGRSCEFLHPEGTINPRGMICPFYAAGSCGYGLSCIFAHVLPTDRAYHMKPCLMNRTGHCPNGDGCVFYHEKPNPARALDSRSTIPCSFWVRGYCAKGEKCPFAHPDEYWAYQSPFERVPISGDESKKDQSNKPEEGTTRESEPAVPKSQIACKFWAQGNCPLGDKCEYRHDLFLHTRT